MNLAASVSGRVVVNLNFTAGKAAMSSAAAQAGLRTLVTSRNFIEKASLELPDGVEVIWIEEIRSTISRTDRAVALVLACAGADQAAREDRGATRRITVDDTVAVIFSSGSEGDPKGAVLSHFNIDSEIEAIGQIFHIYPTDRLLDVLPLFHSFGYLLLWLGTCRGMGLICHVKPQESGVVGELVERYWATVLFATPAFLHIYTRRCAPAQFGSLRLAIAGADKLPDAHLPSLRGHLRPPAAGRLRSDRVLTGHRRQRSRLSRPGFYQPGSRRGTVGHTLPGVSVRIIKPESIAGAGAARKPGVHRTSAGKHRRHDPGQGPERDEGLPEQGRPHPQGLVRRLVCDGRPRHGGRGWVPHDHRTD